jgi:tetratricopeptide (TPR) repeat protein
MSNANAALHELLVAGHLEQVVSQARRILDRQPESIPTHYYLALALLRLRRSGEAWVSVQILLERLPNAGFAHHAASEYFSLTRKYRKAREHIRQALALESHSAPFHYDACRAALRLRKIREAREEIDAARQLDPRDADIIRLYVLVHGLNTRIQHEARGSACANWKPGFPLTRQMQACTKPSATSFSRNSISPEKPKSTTANRCCVTRSTALARRRSFRRSLGNASCIGS